MTVIFRFQKWNTLYAVFRNVRVFTPIIDFADHFERNTKKKHFKISKSSNHEPLRYQLDLKNSLFEVSYI